VRIGTPAVTTRGMKEGEIKTVVDFIYEALNSVNNEKVLSRIKEDVRELCNKFPIYRHRLS
jgi:glycine hydroxymethyltransferase